ncbi:unnamed protein product [Closterium sp. NIES-64]|nr:unnamed protein product [Closterium sp. Naga37s-1]CAI5983571.1 unnamed protein product [Closterium sp. NIES-65]CAI5984614.1 unnamed protein product [Closterium sp. NIES-64]
MAATALAQAAAPAALTSSLCSSQPKALSSSASLTGIKVVAPTFSKSKQARRNQIIAAANAKASAAVSAEAKAAPKTSNQYAIQAFTNWLLLQEQAGVIDNEMTIVLSSISLACKQIASLVTRAGISNLTGVQGAQNVQGEDQKKLDVVSNEVFAHCLRASGRTGIIASEEEDTPIAVEESYSGNYIVVFDPLDGSSNIDAAVSTGSIFGIYREPEGGCLIDLEEDATLDQIQATCVTNVCQPGKNLLAAGYCMYSSSTILVLTIGTGVFGFTLDPMYGEFVLTHADIKIPKSGKIYSFNEGNYDMWTPQLKKYIDSLKDASSGKPYSARYIGSLVGDFHRTLLYGGIYGYPPDSKNANGKLRLLYECAPMSFLAEQAGGKGSDGFRRVMDIMPEQVHQRVPLFVGSPDEVEKLEKYLAEK